MPRIKPKNFSSVEIKPSRSEEVAESQEQSEVADLDQLPDAEQLSYGTQYLERLSELVKTMNIFSREEETQLENSVEKGPGFLSSLFEKRQLVSSVQLVSLLVPFMSACNSQENQDIGEMLQTEYLEARVDEEAEMERVMDNITERSKISVGEALQRIADDSPTRFIENLPRYVQDPAAGEVLLDIADRQAKSTQILSAVEVFGDQPYANQVIDRVIENDPMIVVEYVVHDFDGAESPAKVALMERLESGESGQYLAEVMQSELGPFEQQEVSNILPYAEAQGLTPEEAFAATQDQHQKLEALLYTAAHGSETQQYFASESIRGDGLELIKVFNDIEHRSYGERFEPLRGASLLETYGLATHVGDEAIESTGKRFVRDVQKLIAEEGQASDQFVESVDGYRVHEFMALAARRGLLDDFFAAANPEGGQERLMERFLGDLAEGSVYDTQRKMNEVAQVIIFEQDTGLQEAMAEKIKAEYEAAVVAEDKKAEFTYGVLSGLFQEGGSWLGDRAGEYRVELHDSMEVADLVDEDGESNQVYYFYNDEDGAGSYLRTLGEYYNSSDWEIEDKGSFTKITSTNEDGNTVIKYIGKPQFSRFGSGEAHDAFMTSGEDDYVVDIQEELAATGNQPQVEIHRGHSYWNSYTIQSLSPETALYLDGSCGGIATVDSALAQAPDAQFIANSGTGRAGFNDIISKHIDESILSSQDVDWGSLEREVEKDVVEEYSDDPGNARYLHNKYIYPDDARAAAQLASIKFMELYSAYEQES